MLEQPFPVEFGKSQVSRAKRVIREDIGERLGGLD